jgi:hypothetical protein
MIAAFILSMPGSPSWNGKWSGSENVHAVVHSVRSKSDIEKYEKLIKQESFVYCWDDGWMACINVVPVDAQTARKLRRESKGFCGYNWMIDSIIRTGEISDKTTA